MVDSGLNAVIEVDEKMATAPSSYRITKWDMGQYFVDPRGIAVDGENG